MASAMSFGDANTGFQAGIINGPVHAEIRSVLGKRERPETPPEPSSNVPFRRDPDFVERDDLFGQIKEKCVVAGSWTALVGLGGVGKSQLAIEYVYRVRKQSPQTWVLWVHASNAARFEQGFQDIADFLKIPDRRSPKANIFKLVHNQLRDSKTPWLLILDNIDEADFLFNTRSRTKVEAGNLDNASRPLKEYLPRSERGSILITSRNEEAALKLLTRSDLIHVRPMVLKDALALFQKKLGTCDDSEDVTELATMLEFMPLAIVQAASYITQRGPRCSVSQYLHKLRQNDATVAKLLDARTEDLRRDWEANNSILLTWHISFDYIHKTRPSAADLLSLMSFFDRQGIPEALLQPEPSNSEDHEGTEDGTDSFEEDFLTLRKFSFVSITGDQSVFEMHRLVQLATRIWLETQGELERWKGQSIRNLRREFPRGNYENWMRCQALLPHARLAASQRPKEPELLEVWAEIMYRVSWYMDAIGSTSEAEKLATASAKARVELLGEEHPNTLISIDNLASIYKHLGRWKEAEEIQVREMEASIKVLGEEHPNTLTSMNNLTDIYLNQGRYKEAEELGTRVMEVKIRVQGEEHPNTLNSINTLADIYANQGRYKEAEELGTRVMEARIRVQGEKHPDTLTSMSNLTGTYANQGRHKEAEELGTRVMEARMRVQGEEHPRTLNSMHNLAATWSEQGRNEEAVRLMNDCFRLRAKVLGEEHPDTLNTMDYLAHFWKQHGRPEEAIRLMSECVRLRTKVLGDDHSHTLTSTKALNWWTA